MADEHDEAPARYSSELETALYRITQEALSNAQRHGGARQATITIDQETTTVRLTIQDDGRGFDTTASTRGFGLLGMHERVQLLGGALETHSTPGTAGHQRCP